jgi:hypothetical protein
VSATCGSANSISPSALLLCPAGSRSGSHGAARRARSRRARAPRSPRPPRPPPRSAAPPGAPGGCDRPGPFLQACLSARCASSRTPVLSPIGMLLCSGCRSERFHTFRPKDASRFIFPASLELTALRGQKRKRRRN